MLTVTNQGQFTIQTFLVDSAGGVEVLLLPETMVSCMEGPPILYSVAS